MRAIQTVFKLSRLRSSNQNMHRPMLAHAFLSSETLFFSSSRRQLVSFYFILNIFYLSENKFVCACTVTAINK